MSRTTTFRLIVSITALALSRAAFLFINDPEGPNLLVVTMLAACIYFVSRVLCAYASLEKRVAGSTLLLVTVCVQMVLVAVLVIVMRLMP